MTKHQKDQRIDDVLATQLILDELFDLTLYQGLRGIAKNDLRQTLDELIQIETQHFTFWQNFFHTQVATLDFARRVKLRLITFVCRLFGERAVHLVLEAVEVYGVRKYLLLWDAYKGHPLGDAVRGVLEDEFKHEEMIVSGLAGRKINPDRIRNIFLGFNDGLVEIVGAVSGFFAAFHNAAAVLVAGFTTAVAGALSMAAGAYVAASSENEVRRMELGKRQFLGEGATSEPMQERPSIAALLVSASYLIGALVPVLPVLFGARTPFVSLMTAGVVLIVVSVVLSFLSGMNMKKRILTNVVIMAVAVAITFAIGTIARGLLGVSL